VVINVAASADGKIDTRDRHGAPISGERDRERVDALRASVDAVMVGSHTLHDEDPRLTVKSEARRAERVARGEPPNPAKVAVASHLGLAPACRFLTSGPARVVVFVPLGISDPTLTARGVELYSVGHGRVDLAAVMSTLTALGLRRVLVEGGGTLNFELLRLGLVDELQLYIAPLVFGGATAPTLADGAGMSRELAIRLSQPTVEVWADGGVLLRYMVERL
jgi:2,5-diamino-6-(ribosylamino)-4(3H)-pyrimidinone 5'-phosphate reductase